jgi:hypothetical protein
MTSCRGMLGGLSMLPLRSYLLAFVALPSYQYTLVSLPMKNDNLLMFLRY